MYTILFLLTTVILVTSAQEFEILSNILESANTPINVIEADVLLLEDKLQLRDEKVRIQLYYECLCPGCKEFDTTEFLQVSKRLENYLDVHTYPYGNTQTIVNKDGTFYFICHAMHGKEECYGNMLHACAIDILANVTASIEFNACLMNNTPGSNDVAADTCGQRLGVDAASIKKCAKGQKGNDLLKYYGDESHKVNYHYVPFVLVNGVEWNQDTDYDFLKRVCQEFKVQPSPCKERF